VLLLVLLVTGGLYPALTATLGRLEFGVLAVALLGMFLYGAAVLAVGLFFSALTENQVIALVSTILTLLVLTVLGWWGMQVQPPWSPVLRHVSLATHAEPFGYGLLRLSDCVFFLSLVGFFLYLCVGVLEGKRWRSGARK
jgi:ABC-2 type transport system permease protein